MMLGRLLPRDVWFWAFVGLVIILIVAFSVLWATRMATTNITIDAAASEISFTLKNAQQLLGPLAVGSLRVAGLSTIEIPQRGKAPPQVIEMSRKSHLGLMAHPGIGRRDSLTIDLGSLPGGTRVWLAAGDRSWTYKLFLRLPKGGEISVTALGSVAIRVHNFGDRSQIFDTPRAIRLGFERDADLTIELRGGADVRLIPGIPITRLDLHRLPQHVSVGALDEGASSADSGIRPIPTLVGGTIIFEDLADKQAVLYPGQQLFVHPTRDSQLLHVVLGKERISFTLQGTVAGLKTGHSGQRNLMPTQFQCLQNQDWAKFAAGGVASLLTLLGSLVTWWSRKAA